MNKKKKTYCDLNEIQINRLAQQCFTNCKTPMIHNMCASQYVETALFCFCTLLVVLCHIYIFNLKTTRKLEITKESLSVNPEHANKYCY